MEYVEPIRDIKQIDVMKKVLARQSQRNLLLFVLGINTGIRICDLLTLKVRDVFDGKEIKEFLFLQDKKSKQTKGYYLNDNVRKELKKYLESEKLAENDYLFRSTKDGRPITRQHAYRIINQAAKEVGIEGKIGMHTLRKTFGYHAYRKGIAISLIMEIYNHHSPSETLKYIGIDKNEKRLVKIDVNL